MISKTRCNIQVATEKKIKGAGGSARVTRKRKRELIKYNMTRDDDPARGEIQTTISLVSRGVPQKHRQWNAAQAYAGMWPVDWGNKGIQRHVNAHRREEIGTNECTGLRCEWKRRGAG